MSPFRCRENRDFRLSTPHLRVQKSLSKLWYVFPCRSKVVALLLDIGGNPNEVINRTTIWKHALRGVTWCRSHEQLLEIKRQHFQIIKLLVKAGADPCRGGGSALDVITTAFEKYFPAEVSSLAKQLRRGAADFDADGRCIDVSPARDISSRGTKFSTWFRKIRRGKAR